MKGTIPLVSRWFVRVTCPALYRSEQKICH